MFGSLGLPEILLILVLALLIFGPKRLPEVGRTIGKGLAEFRRATTDLKRSVNAELSLEDDERPSTSRRPHQTIQGVGRTASEASTSRELPAPSAPDSEPASAAPEGTTPRSDSGGDANSAGSAEAEPGDATTQPSTPSSDDEPSKPVSTG